MGFKERVKYVLNGEDGAISLELVGFIAVICVILVALFIFRDQITSAIGRGGKQVDSLNFGNKFN